MRCDKIGELLSPYLDQMTNEKESKCVETHIVLCSKCRNELEQLRRMCNAVHILEVPEVPDTFLKDFHQRLANENLKYFGSKHIRTPKRPGWIAAGIAGLALAVGIYASSFLPFGNMVAGLQERFDKNKQPSTASIDKILNNVKSHLAEKNASPSSPDISKPAEVASTDQEKEIPGKITKLNNPVETGPAVSAQTEATDVVNTTVKVADIGSSIQKVMGIAGENGGQYSVLAASSGVQAFSSTRTKAVSIKVDPENTDEVLTDLKDIGIAAEPQYSKTDITAQVNEVESNITFLQSQIAELENSSDKSTADNTKLDQLKNQLFQCSQKKDLLKRTVINIYLVEEGTP